MQFADKRFNTKNNNVVGFKFESGPDFKILMKPDERKHCKSLIDVNKSLNKVST